MKPVKSIFKIWRQINRPQDQPANSSSLKTEDMRMVACQKGRPANHHCTFSCYFAPKHLCQTLLCPFAAKKSFLSEMVQKGPYGPKRVPNGQKHLVWPFWSLLDHFGALTSLPCLAIFGPKWTIFGPSPVMNGRPHSAKKAHHHVYYVWPACGAPSLPLWNINVVAIYEKCQK